MVDEAGAFYYGLLMQVITRLNELAYSNTSLSANDIREAIASVISRTRDILTYRYIQHHLTYPDEEPQGSDTRPDHILTQDSFIPSLPSRSFVLSSVFAPNDNSQAAVAENIPSFTPAAFPVNHEVAYLNGSANVHFNADHSTPFVSPEYLDHLADTTEKASASSESRVRSSGNASPLDHTETYQSTERLRSPSRDSSSEIREHSSSSSHTDSTTDYALANDDAYLSADNPEMDTESSAMPLSMVPVSDKEPSDNLPSSPHPPAGAEQPASPQANRSIADYYSQRIQKLERELHETTLSAEYYEQQFISMDQELRRTQHLVADLQAKSLGLEQSYARLMAQYTAAEKSISELQDRIDVGEHINQLYENSITEKLNDYEANLQLLTANSKAVVTERDGLMTQNQALRSELDCACRTLEHTSKSIRELETACNEQDLVYFLKTSELESENSTLSKYTDRLEASVRLITADAAAAKDKVSILDVTITTQTGKISELNGKLEHANEKLAESRAELSRATEVAMLQNEELAQVWHRLAEQNASLFTLRNELTSLRHSQSEAESSYTLLQREAHETRLRLASTEQQLCAAHNAILSNEDFLSQARDVCGEHEAVKAKLREDIESQRCQLMEAHYGSAAQEKRHQEELASLRANVDALSKNVKSIQSVHEGVADRCAAATRRVVIMEAIVSGLTSDTLVNRYRREIASLKRRHRAADI